MGGVQRLRVSSQSLKRAWRTSDVFKEALSGQIGTRTKEMGLHVYERLKEAGVAEKPAKEWAQKIARSFGKLKGASK
jgi:CRISPR system Cascade subunit CasC